MLTKIKFVFVLKKHAEFLILLSMIFFYNNLVAQNIGAFKKSNHLILPKIINEITGQPLTEGVYTIGKLGDFTTIQYAFNKLRFDGISGPVTFELIDTLYQAPSDQYGFVLFGPILGSNEKNQVTLKSGTNKNVTIEGEGMYVLLFIDVSFFIIDGGGLDADSSITVHQYLNYDYEWNSAIEFDNNSHHNVVRNVSIINENYTRNSLGISFWVLDDASSLAPEYNLIEDNYIKKAGIGIFVSGSVNQRALGNTIRRNYIGSGLDSFISWGIQLQYSRESIIEYNEIQNIRFMNKDFAITPGINSYFNGSCIIRNNLIHNIYDSDSHYGAAGILLSGGSHEFGNNNSTYNNIIYDIQSESSSNIGRVTGIQTWYQNNLKIYYNSIHLYGKGKNISGSAALYISEFCLNVESKNNILINTRDESNYCASSIYNYTCSNLTSDNNVLYCNEKNYNCITKIKDTRYHSLIDWQAASEDENSFFEMPNFIDSALHIDENIPTNIESHGIPIIGINLDFDGDTRCCDFPDIGADELNGITLTGFADEIKAAYRFTLSPNYPNPFNPTTTINYSIPSNGNVQLKIYDILGREVATLVNQTKAPGNYEVNFNASNLPSGVYLYQLKAGEFIQTKKMILMR